MDYTIIESHPSSASRERVWDVVQDLPKWPDWDPYIMSVSPTGGGEPRPGQHWIPGMRWDERVRRGPFTPRFRLTVTAITPGRYVEWRARYLLVTGVHGWEVLDEGPGSRIVSRETFSGPAPIIAAARLIFRLFGVRAMTRTQLAAMARRAEYG